jgi:hypothetical protein
MNHHYTPGTYKGIPFIIKHNFYEDGTHRLTIPNPDVRKEDLFSPEATFDSANHFARYLIDKNFCIPDPFNNDTLSFDDYRVTTTKFDVLTVDGEQSFYLWNMKLYKNENIIHGLLSDDYHRGFDDLLSAFASSRLNTL